MDAVDSQGEIEKISPLDLARKKALDQANRARNTELASSIEAVMELDAMFVGEAPDPQNEDLSKRGYKITFGRKNMEPGDVPSVVECIVTTNSDGSPHYEYSAVGEVVTNNGQKKGNAGANVEKEVKVFSPLAAKLIAEPLLPGLMAVQKILAPKVASPQAEGVKE